MKRNILIWIVFLLVLSMLNGCSKNSKDKNTFTFATWAAGTELEEFQAVIDKVNEEAAGEYKIEVLSIPSDYYVKDCRKKQP